MEGGKERGKEREGERERQRERDGGRERERKRDTREQNKELHVVDKFMNRYSERNKCLSAVSIL